MELLVFTGFRLIDAGRSLVWLNVLFLLGGALATVALYTVVFLFDVLLCGASCVRFS